MATLNMERRKSSMFGTEKDTWVPDDAVSKVSMRGGTCLPDVVPKSAPFCAHFRGCMTTQPIPHRSANAATQSFLYSSGATIVEGVAKLYVLGVQRIGCA